VFLHACLSVFLWLLIIITRNNGPPCRNKALKFKAWQSQKGFMPKNAEMRDFLLFSALFFTSFKILLFLLSC
jgi:hypothetical protein